MLHTASSNSIFRLRSAWSSVCSLPVLMCMASRPFSRVSPVDAVCSGTPEPIWGNMPEPTNFNVPGELSHSHQVGEAQNPRPSNRRRTARPVQGRDVVQRRGPILVDSDCDASSVDEAFLDALENDLRTPQRRFQRIRRRVCSDSEGRHQRRGLASKLEGDARCSSSDATTVAASSNVVRAAHVEFCQSVHRICTDSESSTEEIGMPTRAPRSIRIDFTNSSSDPSSRLRQSR